MASRVQINLQQEVAIRRTNELIVKHCLLAARHFTIVSISLILLFVTSEPMRQHPTGSGRWRTHNGMICFFYFTTHTEHLVQTSQCLTGASKNYYTTHRPIKPMHHAQENLARLVILLLNVSLHIIGQSAVACFVTLHNLARCFVNNDNVVVFVNNLHG